MDNNSIIDKITFDVCTHAEAHPNVFVCDKAIAPAIAELNKKEKIPSRYIGIALSKNHIPNFSTKKLIEIITK